MLLSLGSREDLRVGFGGVFYTRQNRLLLLLWQGPLLVLDGTTKPLNV